MSRTKTGRRRVRGGPTQGDGIELRLDGYHDDGLATGRLEDWEVRVRGGARGDLVRAVVEHRSPHGPVVWARIEEVLEPGPGRVRSPCPLSPRCGGCPWIHLDYEEQLAAKKQRAEDVGRLLEFGSEVTLHRSPDVLHYRNRGKYVVARTKRGLILGAYEPRSHRVVETIGCLAVEPVVDSVARQVAAILTGSRVTVYQPKTGMGMLRYVAIRANHRAQTLVTLVVSRDASPALLRVTDRIAGIADVVGVTLDVNPDPGNVIFSGKTRLLEGTDRLEEQFGRVSVELAGHSFGQVNRAQATRMYERVVDLALRPIGAMGVERVADLFSGPGAMSLMLATSGVEVLGVEMDGAAVASAGRSAAAAGLSDACRFEVGDANEWFSAESFSGFSPDVLLVNPPRSGLRPSLLGALARQKVPRIVYVSCNPAALVRDAGFLRDVGYYVRDLEGFDMMPHTPHLELVCVLQWPEAGLSGGGRM